MTKIDSGLYVGIDPGKSGGICVLTGKEVFSLIPMPPSPVCVVGYLTKIHEMIGPISLCTIENLTLNKKFSRNVIRVMAHNLGVLEGIMAGLKIPYELARPQAWQSLMYADPRVSCLEGKSRSIKAAKLLSPGINLKPTARCSRDSDGMADAYLIARYGTETRGER